MLKAERIAAMEAVMVEKFATDIALAEMVRFILGEITFRENPDEQTALLQKAEASLIDGLKSRTLWDQATDEQNTLGRKLASEYVTKLVRSVRHPAHSDLPKRQLQ